jgi:hypothetical protein
MDANPFPTPMPKAPTPGELVRWRCSRHAKAIGWADAFGTGPFLTLRVVDRSTDGIPCGVVVQTRRGEREINEVWLALDGESADARRPAVCEGYRVEVLDSLTD